MIGKLFLQDLRSTWRPLLTSIGIAVLVAAVSVIPAMLHVPILGEIGMGLGMVAIGLITPMALALLVVNYWRTMYGREGYFTMSLPVRGRTIFAAKVLYGVVVTMLAAGLTVAGTFGMTAVVVGNQGGDVRELAQEAFSAFDASMVWVLVVLVALQLVFFVVAGAGVISIGSEARFNHLGFGAPVIGWVIVYFVMQITSLLAMLFIPFGIRIFETGSSEFVAQSMLPDLVEILRQLPETPTQPTSIVLGLGLVLVSAAGSILFAWWGSRSVDRHTSLR